jgi:hypothetical protein
VLPLIARGDAVRVLDVTDCPTGWGDAAFDDSGWSVAKLPIAAVPDGGACLRAQFDVHATLERYRWLTITLSSKTRARLNAGKAITSDQERGGLDWTAADDVADPTPQPAPTRQYTLDLRLFPTLLSPSRNVLALQVPATRDPVDVEAVLMRDDGSMGDIVQVVKGPYRLRPSPTSMRVAWESDRAAPSWLVVDGKSYDGGWTMHHEVTLDGLVAGRVYSYYVATAESTALPPECQSATASTASSHLAQPELTDDDFWKYIQRRDACARLAQAVHSPARALRATAIGAAVRIAVVGDTRADASMPSTMIDAVTREAADLVVHTGDVVATGSDSEWQRFFDAGAALLANVPIAPVPGERDNVPWGDRFAQLFGGGAPDAEAAAAGRSYSLDVGSVHLAMIDSTAAVNDVAVWLDGDLTAAAQNGAEHLIVVMHRGPWSAGPSRGNAAALAAIVPVAAVHGVEAIVSGHDNIYEHGVGQGIPYFVTGGGGAALDPVTPRPTTVTARALSHYLLVTIDSTGTTVRAKDADGVVFDEVHL